MKRAPLILILTAVLLLGVSGGWFLRGAHDLKLATASAPEPIAPQTGPTVTKPLVGFKTGASRQSEIEPPQPGAAGPQSPAPVLTVDLASALQDGTLKAEFRGNGRERLRMMGSNGTRQAVRLSIPAGQAFESANGSVVALRARTIDFAPGENRLEDFPTLAVASLNRVSDATYVISATPQPKLQPLLDFLAEHPEISTPAAQTAALALLENLPASAFAKFAETGNDLPNQWDTTAFKVETSDIVQALFALRQMGIPDEQLAITVDPQTKIEAMVDPLAHAAAMRYYNIKPESEWAYWKHELLEGDQSTRHYALHGIARNFPEVALPMLPRWAREAKTSQVFRVVAIQALAETQRIEAYPVLKALEVELGPETELGRTAREAASYLDATMNKASKTAPGKTAVAFRMTKTPGAL
ncbi:MAG: hypothetical protein WCP06_08485 [Verrucomicrobiota bacterium]